MLKQNNVPIESSNIALYGSAYHEKCKEVKANAELEFHGSGAAVGTEVFRIENFGVKKLPSNNGTFFSGDSYLVLNTYKKNQASDALSWNLHFWLGNESSKDEIGTAAYKAVELDDYLKGAPVQYREVQGSESAEFLALFPHGIKLLSGGIASAFNEVKAAEYRPRLLLVKQSKNKKHVRVTEVPLKRESLNNGDVFVIDNGLSLFQWNGESAGVFEKRKGIEVIDALKQERLGRPKSVLLEGTEDNDEFWGLLGGKGEIPAAIPDVDDNKNVEYVLVRVSDASGKLKAEEVGRAPKLSRSLLTSDDVFILDLVNSLVVYIGKGCSKQEKNSGVKYALEYLINNNRATNIPISRVVEGGESDSFLSAFN